MTGGEAEIELSNGDWMVERISVNGIDVSGWVYDESGRETYRPAYLKGLGMIRCDDPYMDITVERPESRMLKLKIGQSVATAERKVEIWLSTDYQQVPIVATMDACGGYEFERIEYGDITYTSGNNMVELGWALTIVNSSENGGTQKFDVFNEDAVRKVRFPAFRIESEDIPHAQWYEELMMYLDGPFEVPIPDAALADGKLQFSGLALPFNVKENALPLELPDETFETSFGPGVSRLEVYWGYDEYSVEYTVWLRHPDGGKPLSFSGIFNSKTYNGEWAEIIVK